MHAFARIAGASLLILAVGRAQQAPTTGPFDRINVSMDLLFAAGGSSEPDARVLELQGGEHDPRKNGFTVQQAELQLNGEIDRFLYAQGVLVSFLDPESGETRFELEEAWVQSQELPYHLQVKAGHYFTEFGRVNPLHPHAWDWQDQPVILSRVFGPEGMRAPGARVSWLLPTHQYAELFLGAQNGNGETMPSFLASDEAYEERAIAGRPYAMPDGARALGDLVWTGRAATTFEVDDETRFGVGASLAFGANATGGDTLIAGVDFAWQWYPGEFAPGKPFLRLQGEYLWREFEAPAQTDVRDPSSPVGLPAQDFGDHGGYLYGLLGFDNGLGVGVRVEHATGSGQSYLGAGAFGRSADAFRTDRLRISPLLQYQVSRKWRFRLQYNFDQSDHLANDAHSVWFGCELLLGSQPRPRVGRDGLSGCGCR